MVDAARLRLVPAGCPPETRVCGLQPKGSARASTHRSRWEPATGPRMQSSWPATDHEITTHKCKRSCLAPPHQFFEQ